MSTANGGSLDDCITNLFALTELNGLQWRRYECPQWSLDPNPRTLLQSEPILVAYSKLQTDGILSVWRRSPKKVLPQVISNLPAVDGVATKELWVFWYGSTEPEEIERHCNGLDNKKNEDEAEEGTANAIPYDVRCLLYKAWNTQMEKHYRSKRYLQIGRWFFRPQKFLDPNAAFVIDDFALAHSHSFNIVGGNSMCMAMKTQLQPNLVQLAPFHIERNRKFKGDKIEVLLAPWSLNGHISLRYSVTPVTPKEEEEVEKQLTEWKEANMYIDVKKRRKRRREDGGETEGEESEDEAWGTAKMPKMIRIEVDGGIRMWWPTQYVLVTLEETRRLVRDRFPVADSIKSVPEKVAKCSMNRFIHLTSSEASLRISQAVIDNGNFKKSSMLSMNAPPETDLAVIQCKRRFPGDRSKNMKEKLSFEERTKKKLNSEEGTGRRVRVSSVNSDYEEEEKKDEEELNRELKKMMKSRRYNWRGKNGRALNKMETELKCLGSSSSEEEETEKGGRGEEMEEREWRNGNKEEAEKIAREINMQAEQSSYHFQKNSEVLRRKEDESGDEERLARSPFTPVRVLSPIDKKMEIEQMVETIKEDLGITHNFSDILREYGTHYDVNSAATSADIHFKPYHSRRRNQRLPNRAPEELVAKNKSLGVSMLDEVRMCSSDEEFLGEGHECSRRREITPIPVKPLRIHSIPDFEMEQVGGVNAPPIFHFKPDKVVRSKPSLFNHASSNRLEFPNLGECDEEWGIMEEIKELCYPDGFKYESDDEKEKGEDLNSTGSSDVLLPLSAEGVAVEDAGEGTSSGAENWPVEDVEMSEELMQSAMDSSGELMDTFAPLHSDSVLSPPASNERADSINSMYHRLPGGPHSVGDNALNKIYPTPPSLLQVDICSPAMMGGPHSQARRDDMDDGCSSHASDDERIMDEIHLKDEEARGDHRISRLQSDLSCRRFFDNAPKSDVPVSHRFGSLLERRRVPEKRELPVYNKKNGERKEQIPPHHMDALAGIDNFTSRKNLSSSIAASNANNGMPWQQPPSLSHPSMGGHQMQYHQSQPGPSMVPPQSHLAQMQGHPAYMGGQMGGFPGQPGMRPIYPSQYGTPMQQQMMQQPGFSGQQQYPMGGQMAIGGQPGQPGYHPGAVPMRPPGYPYPQGAATTMTGVHPMQTQGMNQQMGYATMQNQMMMRGGMPQGSYPPQYGSPMGMMNAASGMGGVQMGQYGGGGQMQPGGVGMQQMQHGQPMIAGAPHPMGMASQPPFPVAPSASSFPPATSSVSGNQQRTAVGIIPSKKNTRSYLIDEERTMLATRRGGGDPYVNSLPIAPKRLFYKGNMQLKNELDLYTTERMLERERRKGDSFGSPMGGSEGLSIVVAVMLQDTILNLHFDWVFDSCPICACTTSIRSRELGVYIRPPDVLEESVEMQNMWGGMWTGFHSDSSNTTCSCGFSVIRHRLLSMRAGLFLEDSSEATGDENSGTNPNEGASDYGHIWFDPSSKVDRALVETLRGIALTTDLGRFVAAIKNISSVGVEKERRKGRRKKSDKIPSIGSIGSPRVEYVISQMDRMELLLMGNSALQTARLSGKDPSPSVGDSPYFHPWGLQIASDVADPTEMEIKNLLEDVKPLIEGAVREARKLPSSASSSVIEGPLTWKSLAAKNVKSSGNGEEDSHMAEPIPLIELSTEKEAIRVAPTVIKNWEHFNLGPIDVPKDVLYLAVVPDDDRVHDMTLVYMRRLGKMYELNLRLGRHVGYLAKDESKMRSPVREGIVRAGTTRSHYAPYGVDSSSQSPSTSFIRQVEKLGEEMGCGKEFIQKLTSYVQCLEDVICENLINSRIYDRETFRECVGYALMHRKANQRQKNNNPSVIARHERDSEEGSPPAGEEEMRRQEEERRKESHHELIPHGALADALGIPSGSSSKGNKKAKRPFGQNPPYGIDGEMKLLKPPDEEPAALPHTIVIYLTLWPCWGSEGRDGEAARVTTIALVKAFNAVMAKLKPKQRGICQLELLPMQRLEEAVGCGADMDRLDRSSNLNTWQIGNMNSNGEVYPTDRPKIEDILKEVSLGIYRKPRFLHCDWLKNSLPKSMTKFGPASATLDWIEKKDGKRKTIYRCQSVPFQLAATPAIIAKNDAKYSQLMGDEVSLYISYCLVATDFIVVTLTDNLGARNESAVLNLKPKNGESAANFRSLNKSSVRDGLDKLWKFIEGAMLNESKPLRLVIGKLGKMGHGEFKAWCHVLSRSNLKKYCSRVRDGCTPCNANAGAPTLLSACLVSTEPEAHLQVLPSYSIPSDPSGGAQKKIRPLHTPGDNTITHIMVFPVSPAIQLTASTDMGGADDDGDEFGDFGEDVMQGFGGDDMNMNDIMNDIMTGDGGEGGERAAARNQHLNSFFDGALESGVQNQPLAAGWMISTAPGGDLPEWFWSSCPSLKRRLPVHLRTSLHINEAQLMRSDELMKKDAKEQEISHALDSQKTDEVLRHVLEQYNDLSWLALDSITQERRSCLPIHIQALTRLHDTVLNLIL
ncbi:hypothetical protein PMAYCL1PPCAC_07365 [Pristionchus mayeri]|uniref:Mediator of RNA polymerase II transcription subunit 13 n=1 Tax=Pristionchus mayeri TaxID=1317129 RepID=A0AAN4ZHQ8_9BILA|nr:hypothetical protein PMAYCL1PPCAC_07365 [Pristionchus mayeri]